MTLEIEVVLAYPEKQYHLALTVPDGTVAREAVKLALAGGLTGRAIIDLDPLQAPLGIYGECVEDDYELQAHDRVEIYRPLRQDPKELRRKRANRGKSRR